MDQYWNLDVKQRHRVGWSVVLAGVILLGTVLWSVSLGIYNLCVWIDDLSQPGVAEKFEEQSKEDREIACLDWYSGNYRHRKFTCGEHNRKRIVNLRKDFKDLNAIQLIAARRLGIPPTQDRESLDSKKGKLVKLKDTRFYKIDRMTHSAPYLVPDAADFLTALGERWTEYHGTNSRFIVTSCLRTESDIKNLRRRNVNATKESCHRYGTTFDITYVRFDRHGRVQDAKLKADLARALYDMKAAGHCYVKYEYKQSCFHVTVRPR